MQADQHAYAENLRGAWDGAEIDPLVSALQEARRARDEAQRRMRLLLAYGRELVHPHPYRLETLAHAASMSVSGVSTGYTAEDTAQAAALAGIKPRPRTKTPS